MCVCVCVYVYVCMCVCLCVCMYVCGRGVLVDKFFRLLSISKSRL